MAKKSVLKDSGIPEIAAGLGLFALLANERKKKNEKKAEETRYSYKDGFTLPDPSIFMGEMDSETKRVLAKGAALTHDIDRELTEKMLREEYGVDCRVTSFTESARIERTIISCNSGEAVKQILKMRKDFEVMNDSSDIEITQHGRDVYVDVPREIPDTVYAYPIFSSAEFVNANGTPLAIGETVDGKIYVCNLEMLPHLLIAGATGSGKSVLMHELILSVLMHNRPDEVELYLIDPKITEFQPYGRLAYCHTVDDTAQAADLLRNLCDEMDARYAKFAQAGVVDLNAYNQKNPNNKMPRKVVFVDELADMMTSTWKKTVETYIARLSAKARACGIHLVIATQYPTVKVITGQIKANITARIALNVATRTNSMVILDRTGAEKLQKHGDLLFMDNDDPVRIQAPMIERWEIEAAVNELAKNQIDTKTTVKKNKKSHPFLWVSVAILVALILYNKAEDNAQEVRNQQILEEADQRQKELEERLAENQRRIEEEQRLYQEMDRQAEQERAESYEKMKAEIDADSAKTRAALPDTYGQYGNSLLDEYWDALIAPNPYYESDTAEAYQQYLESRPNASTASSTEATTSYKSSSDEIRVNPVQPVVDGSGFNEIRVGEQYLGDTYFNDDNRGYRMNGFDEFYYVNEH